ncbi:MAG: hypothetical protein ACI4I4_00710 [Acutalibacteraceae bacterium]
MAHITLKVLFLNGRPSFENEMNMLLTMVEKMFVQLDPNAQVSTVKNEITTKRSIF